jgi:hypothetical protein
MIVAILQGEFVMSVTLDLSVTATGGVAAYWLAVDNDDVVMQRDKGKVVAPSGAECVLTCWLTGDEGALIDIVVEQPGHGVRLKTQETIPAGLTKAAGQYRFFTA